MRQMIMALQVKEFYPLFMSIDKAWDNNRYSLVWPSLFDEEARTESSYLSSVLHRNHGDLVYKLLCVEEQELVRSTEWRDGIPHTKEHRYLEDLISEGSDVKWFKISLLNEKEEAIPNPILPDQTTPQINLFQDDDLVFFLNQSNENLTPSVFQDDITKNTMDSRISVLERSANPLQHKLNEKFE